MCLFSSLRPVLTQVCVCCHGDECLAQLVWEGAFGDATVMDEGHQNSGVTAVSVITLSSTHTLSDCW